MLNAKAYFLKYFFLLNLGIIICSCTSKTSKNHSNKYHLPTYEYGIANENLKKYYISKKNKELLNSFYNQVWEANDINGGLLIAQGNTIFLEKYRGFANIEKNIPMSEKTPIHIASISKTLTSFAILKLIEANKIKLHQKVYTIFPKFPYKDVEIFHLLTHRSGLINYANLAEMEHWWKNPNQMLTNKDVLNFYTECTPYQLFPTGTKFQYCNSNFAILASIVEKITKVPFPEAMKIMIFEPLEMNNTYIFEKKHFKTASPSYYSNKRLFPFDRYDLIYGDKNVYSTPRDLFQLSKAMFSKKFLRKSLYDSIFVGYSNEKQGVKNYGLGMRLKIFENKKKLAYHTGLWHGNNSIFIHLEDEDLTIISLGNRKSRNLYSAMSLVSLFGDYPLELPTQDSILMSDSLKVNESQMINSDKLKIKTKNKSKTDSIQEDFSNFETE